MTCALTLHNIIMITKKSFHVLCTFYTHNTFCGMNGLSQVVLSLTLILLLESGEREEGEGGGKGEGGGL